MPKYKCPNCGKEGKEELNKFNNCPNCGDNVIIEAAKKNPLDLDGDGDFDKDDLSLAGKALASSRKAKKRKK